MSRWRLGVFLLALLLGGCFTLPPRGPLPASHALHNPGASPLAALGARPALERDPLRSGFRLMPEGSTAFNARIALIRQARVSIDAQYYIVQSDAVGARFLLELLEAARRGVRVRLLVDGLYVAGKDELLALLAVQPNFEVRVFNPLPVQQGPLAWRLLLSAGELSRINHRMHNKLFVVDDSVAVMGGRNMADEYFMQSGTANFIDMDVLVTGPLLRALSSSFDSYWESRQVWPMRQLMQAPYEGADAQRASLQALLHEALPGMLAEREQDVLGQAPVTAELAVGRLTQTWAEASVHADAPEKITRPDAASSFEDSVTAHTVAAIASAHEQVILVSPYFVPGDRGMEVLRALAARGVETRIVTNALDATDESLVHAGYARYRLGLLRLGARVYELGGRLAARDHHLGDFGTSYGRLHAKLALLDRRRLLMGSMNLDGRSARLNTEIGVAIDSAVLAAQVELLAPVRALDAYELRLAQDGRIVWVEHRLDGSEQATHDEPGAGWLGSVKNLLLHPFVPEGSL